MSIAYQPVEEQPVEPVRRDVVALCELLALRAQQRQPRGVDAKLLLLHGAQIGTADLI